MHLEITSDDIQGAEHNHANNPLSRALQRVTGNSWHIYIGVACEAAAPHRTAILRETAYDNWCLYQSRGDIQPFDCELHLVLPSQGQ